MAKNLLNGAVDASLSGVQTALSADKPTTFAGLVADVAVNPQKYDTMRSISYERAGNVVANINYDYADDEERKRYKNALQQMRIDTEYFKRRGVISNGDANNRYQIINLMDSGVDNIPYKSRDEWGIQTGSKDYQREVESRIKEINSYINSGADNPTMLGRFYENQKELNSLYDNLNRSKYISSKLEKAMATDENYDFSALTDRELDEKVEFLKQQKEDAENRIVTSNNPDMAGADAEVKQGEIERQKEINDIDSQIAMVEKEKNLRQMRQRNADYELLRNRVDFNSTVYNVRNGINGYDYSQEDVENIINGKAGRPITKTLFPVVDGIINNRGITDITQQFGVAFGTKEQQDMYLFLYEKAGYKVAQDYLQTIASDVNKRYADLVTKDTLDNPYARYAVGFGLGVLGWVENVQQALSDKAIPETATEYVQQNLAQKNTSRIEDILYSSSTSAGNMAIPMLLSIATSGALGGTTLGNLVISGEKVARATNAVGVGLSAYGQAKGQALRQGYGAVAADKYGLVNGLSEATLQYFLGKAAGSIVGYGGTLTGIAADKIKNAIVNVASTEPMRYVINSLVDIASDAGGEFVEEYLQEVLDPVYRNITLGEQNGFQFYTDEALDAGIAGALMGGVFGSMGMVRDVMAIRGGVKTVTDAEEQLAVELGKELSEKPKGMAEYYADLSSKGELAALNKVVEYMKSDEMDGEEVSAGYNAMVNNIQQYVIDRDVVDWELFKMNADNAFLGDHSQAYKYGAQKAFVEQMEIIEMFHTAQMSPTLDASSDPELRSYRNIKRVINANPCIFEMQDGNKVAYDDIVWDDQSDYVLLSKNPAISGNRIAMGGFLSLKTANLYLALAQESGKWTRAMDTDINEIYAAGRFHISKNANDAKRPMASFAIQYDRANNSTKGQEIANQFYKAGWDDATEYNKTARQANETIINKLGYNVKWLRGKGRGRGITLGFFSQRVRNEVNVQETLESFGSVNPMKALFGDDSEVTTFSIASTVSHELTHALEHNNHQMYERLRDFVLDYAQKVIPNQLQEFKNELTSISQSYEDYLEEEVVARTMELLWQSEGFVNALMNIDPELFAEVGAELAFILRDAKTTNTMAAWLREDIEAVDAVAALWLEGTQGKAISEYTTEKLERASEEIAKKRPAQTEDGDISIEDAEDGDISTWEEAENLVNYDVDESLVIPSNEDLTNIELDFSSISDADEFFGEESSEIRADINSDTPYRIAAELIRENSLNGVAMSLKEDFADAIDAAIVYMAGTPDPDYAVATRIVREGAQNMIASLTNVNGTPMYVGVDAMNFAHDIALQFFRKYAEAAANISPETAQKIIDEVNRVLEEERERAKQNREDAIRKTKEMMRMRQERAQLRDRIRNQLKKIAHLAQHPTKRSHIPRSLVQYLYDIADALDPTSNRRVSGVNDQWRAIKDFYGELKNDPDYAGYVGAYNAIIEQYIEQIQNITQTKKMIDLNVDELKMVRDILSNILHIFNTGEEFTAPNLPENVQKAVETVIKDLRALPHTGNPFINKYYAETLNPERFFRRLTNYDESNPLMIAVTNLINGELKSMEYQRGYSKLFDKMNENAQETAEGRKTAREYQKRFNKLNSDWWTVELGGKEYEITEAMAISLAMHLRNNDNMRHITNGGLVIPDKKLYSRDWLSNEYLKKAYRESSEVAIPDSYIDAEGNIKSHDIERIMEKFDDFDTWMYETAIEYFEVYSADALNQTSLELDGFKVANVKNYYPIVVDPLLLNSVTYDIEKGQQTTVISSSMLYPRADNAASRILLNGIVQDLNRSAEFVSKYVGLAAPLKDFNRIVRGSKFGDYNRFGVNPPRDSVRSAITEMWGVQADDYIYNLLRDITGTRQSYTGSFFDRLRSNAAQAVLTMNVSVSVKQATSFFTAISELGFAPVFKALVKGGKNQTIISRADQKLIGKYTPILWERTQGMAIQETAEMQMGGRGIVKRVLEAAPFLTDWIRKVDTATVGRLWYAAEYYIDKNRSDLTKGTDEYYDAVAQKYNETVLRTQPNYTVMTRPEVLRSNNQIKRALFMFKTQPLQNAGILIDSIGEYRAKLDAYNADMNDYTRSELRNAGFKLARSITSQAIQAAVFVGLSWFSNLLLHNMKKYEDDETGEITVGSTMWQLMWMYFDSLAGNSVIFDWFEDFGEYATRKWVIGEDVKYYAPSVFGIENLAEIFTTVQEAGDSIMDGKGLSEYQIKTISTDIASLLGIPAENVMNLIKAIKNHATDLANAQTLGDALGLTTKAKTTAQYVKRLLNLEDVSDVMEEYREFSVLDEEAVRGFRDAYVNGDEDDRGKIKSWLKDYFGYTDGDVSDTLKSWGTSLLTDYASLSTRAREEVVRELKDSFDYTDDDVTKKLQAMPKSGKLEKAFVERYRKGESIDQELRDVYKLSDDDIKLLKMDWENGSKAEREYKKETFKAEQTAANKVIKYEDDVDAIKNDFIEWKKSGNGEQLMAKNVAGKYFAKIWQTSTPEEREQLWEYAKAVYDYKESSKKTTTKGWTEKDLTQYETTKLDWDEVGRTGKGNIDLYKSDILENDDGSISTIGGIYFEEDGRYIAIPTIVKINGTVTQLSNNEAIEYYHTTNDYLGKFNTKKEAENYLAKVKEQQSRLYVSNNK